MVHPSNEEVSNKFYRKKIIFRLYLHISTSNENQLNKKAKNIIHPMQHPVLSHATLLSFSLI